VKLFLDICLGLGLAQAAGIRPFTPAIVVGAFAAGDLLVDFGGTEFEFLEQGWWLVLLAVLAVGALLARDRLPPSAQAALQGLGMGIGAVLFAAVLDDDGYAWWPGIPAGIAAAWLAGSASRDVLVRAGARLDEEARSHLPVYAEGVAIGLALLSLLAPPLSLIALAFFAWLLIGGRRRAGEKYAGLRILR
jgi:hypothetical protein